MRAVQQEYAERPSVFRIAIGYVLAVVVAATMTVLLCFVFGWVFIEPNQRLFPNSAEIGPGVTFGILFTAFTALPGFVATILIARQLTKPRWLFYSVCGVLTAVAAPYFLPIAERLIYDKSSGALFELMMKAPLLVPMTWVGGALGGMIYWITIKPRTD